MDRFAAACVGCALILLALQDAFEVVLLPRRVLRKLRLMRLFFHVTWLVWSAIAKRLPQGERREGFLSVYGPFSMVLLFGLWAVCLIVGFGLVQWAIGDGVAGTALSPLVARMFMSGDAFFTLGYGDIVPHTAMARLLIIVEAGTGFGFIALTISYLPVLYEHFSRRDVQLIQLDPRAGSPVSSATLLLRYAAEADAALFDEWLRDWELWAAELVESHSSYPMLAFYRSQHRNHSWLASLSMLLDCCTLRIAYAEDVSLLQASATFAAARRVLDEMAGSLGLRTRRQVPNGRFPSSQQISRLRQALEPFRVRWSDSEESTRICELLQETYEPRLLALSEYLLLPLPVWTDIEDGGSGRPDIVRRLARPSVDEAR